MHKNLSIIVVGILLVCGIVGCFDFRSTYKDAAPDTQSARMSGKDGTYIREVDGDKVSSAGRISPANGNSVNVVPGEHRFSVYCAGNARTAGREFSFKFLCLRGHEYEIIPGQSLAVNAPVEIRDTTAGTSITIQ